MLDQIFAVSPAYLAMTPSGKRVLHIIEGVTSRNGGEPAALGHGYFMTRKMTQASSCKAVKQLCFVVFWLKLVWG